MKSIFCNIFFLCIMTWCYLLEKSCLSKSSVIDIYVFSCQVGTLPTFISFRINLKPRLLQSYYNCNSYNYNSHFMLCAPLPQRYVTLSFCKIQSYLLNTARGIGRFITNTIIFNLLCM